MFYTVDIIIQQDRIGKKERKELSDLEFVGFNDYNELLELVFLFDWTIGILLSPT